MTTTTPYAIAQAVYIEATRAAGANKVVLQLLLTPEVTDSHGNKTKMGMYRRRISTLTPRKTWKSWHAPVDAGSVALTTTDADVVAERMLSFASTTLASLTNPGNEYTLVGVPIVVDVTNDDIKDLAGGKTPYKVFGRVWRSRKNLGFPAEFL